MELTGAASQAGLYTNLITSAIGLDRDRLGALRTAGRNPDDFNIAQLRFGYVASKHDKAWDECEFAMHHLLTKYGQWIGEANDVPGDENYANCLVVPVSAEGLKLYPRKPYARAGDRKSVV